MPRLLENPRDREAWWATVYGVAQSWTRLKRLSSSSSSSVFYSREVKCMDLGDRMLGLNLGFALTDGLTLEE